jgi:hypothetical protein
MRHEEAAVQTNVLLDASRRGEELRYVTAHFRDLQGLRMAPFWAALMLLTCLETLSPHPQPHLAMVAFAIVLCTLPWVYWSGRWYERRYGVVTAPEMPVRSGMISIMNPEPPLSRGPNYQYFGMQAIIFLIWALSLAPEIFRHGRGNPSGFILLTVAFLVVPRCFYRAPDVAIIRFRRVLSVTSLVAIFAASLGFQFGRVGIWPYMMAMCTVFLLLDLYDHWLLTHLLSGPSVEGTNE